MWIKSNRLGYEHWLKDVEECQDLLAHLVGAELDTSQQPKPTPRRFIQQKKSSRDRQESVSFGSPGNLAQSLGHASNEDASSLASSAGAPWRPWLHLGSPSNSGVSLCRGATSRRQTTRLQIVLIDGPVDVK